MINKRCNKAVINYMTIPLGRMQIKSDCFYLSYNPENSSERVGKSDFKLLHRKSRKECFKLLPRKLRARVLLKLLPKKTQRAGKSVLSYYPENSR
jgi:hypothetical protein